jgi:hypothetical protein
MQVINSIIYKIEDRAIHLIVDPNSPIPEIKDALMKFMAYIVQVEEVQKEQQPQVQPEQPKVEPVAEPEQPKQE